MNLRLKSVRDVISKNPFLELVSKNSTYRNNLLTNTSNAIVWIITTALLFFLFLCHFAPICNIAIYFLLVLNFEL